MTSVVDRVVVTGARGRLGSAVAGVLRSRNDVTLIPWSRPDYDLDMGDPSSLLERDTPTVVIHAAAWTDVDGCAHDPALAMRRNADAVALLADACAARAISFVLISTNEVFDGQRGDDRGYAEDDEPSPGNPYGASKLAGEEAARSAFAGRGSLWIIRTAWLYGPPGNDFPAKIVAASDRLDPDVELPVVADETGSPTYAADLARALVKLVQVADGGVYHVVNSGRATRYDMARVVLRHCRPERRLRPISRDEFVRASAPPPWAVLDAEKAARASVTMRGWEPALTSYVESVGSRLGTLAP